MIGDEFEKRKVMAISFTIQAFFFFILSVYAYFDSTNLILLMIIWSGIGLVQSVDFPCLIGTIGAWTQRKNRGMITGLWSTCNNIGNIFGLQTAAIILNSTHDSWGTLMFLVVLIYLGLAGLI